MEMYASANTGHNLTFDLRLHKPNSQPAAYTMLMYTQRQSKKPWVQSGIEVRSGERVLQLLPSKKTFSAIAMNAQSWARGGTCPPPPLEML